jgi:hypothetical protein
MPAPMPAIDQVLVSAWNEQEQNMYNAYPRWLAAYQVAHRKTYATHSKMVGKKKWTRNMGPIMTGVRKEPSPHIRSQATPRELSAAAVKDILDVQEMTINATLKHQKFESRVIPFFPQFNDFLKDHLSATSKDIVEKVDRFADIFVRTAVFHMSPHVYLADKAGLTSVVEAPMWDGQGDMASLADGAAAPIGKTVGWRQNAIAMLGNPGNLSIMTCFNADSFLREDIRAVSWADGSNGQPGDNSAMSGRNILVLSNEAYNQFRFDPFLLDNRRLDLDVVQHGFKGSIGDNITCKIEDLPLRMNADGTFPEPETRQVAAVYNKNESLLTQAYKDAPYEFAWMYAADGYDSLEVGPPPDGFNGTTVPKGFADMSWNGEVKFTKLFNIRTVDEDGTAVDEFNTYGEHLKAICHATYGILGTQRRNVLPILFKRIRGA